MELYCYPLFTTTGTVLFTGTLKWATIPAWVPTAPNINYFSNSDLAISLSNYSNMTIVRMNTGGNLLGLEFSQPIQLNLRIQFYSCMTSDDDDDSENV